MKCLAAKSLLGILAIAFCVACKQETKTLFKKIDSNSSGLKFVNTINETDSFNVMDIENIYNGGGVAIADFNNDGLQDVYLTGNLVGNKLYLNKGGFKFQDITVAAGVNGEGHWSRSASIIDINNDGLMDIYISATLCSSSTQRENILYINKGNNKEGIPSFQNMAKEYHLADTSHTTMAAFFDYDNDGDLDVYLLVNQILKKEYPNQFRPIFKNGEFPSTGKLLRNDWDSIKSHPVFKDVSKEAGVTIEGYGHGVNIVDLNRDGWKDIYITNDFLANNILYINNGNGTFTDKARSYFKHTTYNAMGQDIQDINNDGLADVIELDMNPEDNYRKKMMMPANKYQSYQSADYFGYQYQYIRNTLQLNLGPRVLENDTIGDPVFADIGFMSGISQTDWSWDPLIADFDNDGNRDVIITNGFPKDVTDQDFIVFRNKAFALSTKKEMLSQIPVIKIPNYAYKNNGDLTFTNVSAAWGLNQSSFSNGASYVDLDNDGDLDCIMNNINEEVFLYENKLNEIDSTQHYLNIEFKGIDANINGIGAIVSVFYNQRKQIYENTPYRGYLSSVPLGAHFGLGKASIIDSIVVEWTNNKKQTIRNIQSNQTLLVDEKDAAVEIMTAVKFDNHSLFAEKTKSLGIDYVHTEQDFVDFNIQKLIPHKLSEYGPAMAVADINADGRDDIILGGATGTSAEILLQSADGKFQRKKLLNNPSIVKEGEDMGLMLFDADADGDNDLYICSGGNERPAYSEAYRDRFYINDGRGNFVEDSSAIPKNLNSKSCVRAADFDRDGDLDLFIASRVEPWNFPKPVSSVILRNDSKPGKPLFTDITKTVAADLNNIGMISDAVWSDFDNDGWVDLILAGEWMPLTIFKNNKGSLVNISKQSGVYETTGWWNSIVPGDFDNDGDMDYVLGNLGLNSFYKASKERPVNIYAKDFDRNGSYDAVPSLYLHPTVTDTIWKEFPAHTRADMVNQMIFFRTKFQNFNSYAKADFPKLFSAEELKDVLKLSANYFSHALFRNEGNGKFTVIALPNLVQASAVNGMVADDFDGDGNLDIAINTNDYSTEVIIGRYDAGNGWLLMGDGKGNFKPLSILESGIFIPGNGKSLVKLISAKGNYLIAASQNRDALKIFQKRSTSQCVRIEKNDMAAILHKNDGGIQKQDLNYGGSFLSQSSRFLLVNNNVTSIDIIDFSGKSRSILISKK